MRTTAATTRSPIAYFSGCHHTGRLISPSAIRDGLSVALFTPLAPTPMLQPAVYPFRSSSDEEDAIHV